MTQRRGGWLAGCTAASGFLNVRAAREKEFSGGRAAALLGRTTRAVSTKDVRLRNALRVPERK